MDSKRKQDYNNFFNRRNDIQDFHDKFLASNERVDIPDAKDIIPVQCDCPSVPCEELCTKDCDNESWNKGLKR